MRVRLIHSSELDPALADRWREIQAADPRLANPYFSIELTQAVGRVRGDVHIGVIESDNRVVGFFPHHRRRAGIGRPVALGLSDYHGLVIEPDVEWSAETLLRGCRLVRWEFDHALASQAGFEPFHTSVEGSPIMRVAGGLDAYLARRKELGDGQIKTIRRKSRSLERDLEAHRFVAADADTARLERVFALKSEQCRTTGTYDYFALRWTTELMRELHAIQTPDFAGVLSTVFVGDDCVALHFGIRSRTVWHWWFPTYEHAFSQYSPGLIMLWEITRHIAEQGMDHIDLGKGMSTYKHRLMTDEVPVAEGVVTLPSVWNGLVRVSEKLERLDRHPALRPVLHVPAGLARRARRRLRFD